VNDREGALPAVGASPYASDLVAEIRAYVEKMHGPDEQTGCADSYERSLLLSCANAIERQDERLVRVQEIAGAVIKDARTGFSRGGTTPPIWQKDVRLAYAILNSFTAAPSLSADTREGTSSSKEI